MKERGKESTVHRSDARPVDLPLQDRQLMPERQYLDALVQIAHQQQP
ncbi:hypothetical protein [Actinacidiphila oryziradicis]|nr:hypothetical protein [Actinacidiphila oryziradicis]